MKCLEGFEYRDGNKVEFDGAMGTVVLTYHKPTEPELDFISDAIPSPHFTAAILNAQGHCLAVSKSELAYEAVRSAYLELAAKLAMEDAGLY